MKNISPKEDAAIFKQQFWHLFTVSGWFNTLTNAKYSKDSGMNGCMHLSAPKRCPPLKHGIEQSKLVQWLGAQAGLTSKLAKQVIELFVEQCVEYTCSGTTWNEAARRAHQKRKSHSTTTPKVVEPHPEQVPTLLNWLTDKTIQNNNAMVINEPVSNTAESST